MRVIPSDIEAELRRLREDNEALRYSSASFADLADRLSERIRKLEALLEEGGPPTPLHRLNRARTVRP